MIIKREIENAQFILSKDEIGYGKVLDDFKNSEEIDILTFNISAKKDELLDKLKDLDEKVKVYIVTNIPQRWNNYSSQAARNRARSNIKVYMKKLLPSSFESQIVPFFNFNNHAKIIVTDNIAYIGSANYSDESQKNYESGFIVRDKEFILFLRTDVFPLLISDSEPYFDNVFVEFRIFILNIYSRLFNINQELFTEGFYVKYFENKEFYETRVGNFNVDITKLEDIEDIVFELKETLNKIYSLFNGIYNENREVDEIIERLESIVDNNKIDDIADLVHYDSDIYNLCNFSYVDCCDEYLEENSLEAYDEYLADYEQNASDRAAETFEKLAESVQGEVDTLRSNLKNLLNEVFTLICELKVLSNINGVIDNTNS